MVAFLSRRGNFRGYASRSLCFSRRRADVERERMHELASIKGHGGAAGAAAAAAAGTP